jgi:hypothetical protein
LVTPAIRFTVFTFDAGPAVGLAVGAVPGEAGEGDFTQPEAHTVIIPASRRQSAFLTVLLILLLFMLMRSFLVIPLLFRE